MSIKKRVLILSGYLLGALFVWAIVGCGGSGAGSSTGKVALTIKWPQASRYIPPYGQSLVFALYSVDNPGQAPRNLIVNRPDTLPLIQTVEFDGAIPTGSYSLVGLAATGTNGSGDFVARAADTVFVEPVGITTVALTLASTLQNIELLDVPLTLTVGQSATLQVRVTDQDNNTIILPDGALTWSVLFGGNRISLDPNGSVQALSAGSARVRVSEVGAGLYSEGDIHVQAP